MDKLFKVGLAAMLLLAVATIVVVSIGMSHHQPVAADSSAASFMSPGGNFVLHGRNSKQFGDYYKSSQSKDDNAGRMTATALSKDGRTRIIAVSDPSTEMIYLFEINEMEIPENATLNGFARRIADRGSDVTIVAYADPSGAPAYNQRLSRRRAEALGDYLSRHGVAPGHITTAGKGQTDMFGSAEFDRRAEIHM